MVSDLQHGETNDPSDDWGTPDEPSQPRYAPAYFGDRHFYRVAIWALASFAGLALIGSIVLFALHKDVPDSVVAIGSTAVGALASVLVVNRR